MSTVCHVNRKSLDLPSFRLLQFSPKSTSDSSIITIQWSITLNFTQHGNGALELFCILWHTNMLQICPFHVKFASCHYLIACNLQCNSPVVVSEIMTYKNSICLFAFLFLNLTFVGYNIYSLSIYKGIRYTF